MDPVAARCTSERPIRGKMEGTGRVDPLYFVLVNGPARRGGVCGGGWGGADAQTDTTGNEEEH